MSKICLAILGVRGMLFIEKIITSNDEGNICVKL